LKILLVIWFTWKSPKTYVVISVESFWHIEWYIGLSFRVFCYRDSLQYKSEVFTTRGTYPWSFVTQIFHNVQPKKRFCHIHKIFGDLWKKFFSPKKVLDLIFHYYMFIFPYITSYNRSLFVPLYFSFWSLCCLSVFDIRILIAPLVSSNSSFRKK
jgi:hypothetical protein